MSEQLNQLQTPVRPKLVLVTLVCDKKKLLSEVNQLCKLVERVSEIDYRRKTQSIINLCDGGTGDEQLNNPHSVTVDHNTGISYVADYNNKCVKVFDYTAKYWFKFGDVKGEGKMSYPDSLLIYGDRVFVTQINNYLQVYELDEKFVSRFGSHGNGKLQFSLPYGLSTDEYNGDIYICEYRNNRIQILSENFEYKSEFGRDILYYPLDVKLYKDNIIILDESNPCLHIFNKDLVLHKSVVTRGEGQQLSILITSVLTSLVLFLSQIVTLILFSFSILNLNSFTKSLFLSIQWESQWIKKIELLLCVKLITTVYRFSDTILHKRLLPSFFCDLSFP